MGLISLQIPLVNSPDASEDPKIASNFSTLQTLVNGNLDSTNLAPGTLPTTSSGATNIATLESRTNTAYGTLTTPDQVTGIVLPANGLIAVWYQATWQQSVASAASAAVFLGANQVSLGTAGLNTLTLNSAGIGSNTANDVVLASTSSGLGSLNAQTFVGAYAGDATTGQMVGGGYFGTQAQYGPCYIFAAAGTYTVSVQFKASSGSVTAKNRKLWVRALAF